MAIKLTPEMLKLLNIEEKTETEALAAYQKARARKREENAEKRPHLIGLAAAILLAGILFNLALIVWIASKI